MLHTKIQASKPSGSEEEDFINIFICISMALGPPARGHLGP